MTDQHSTQIANAEATRCNNNGILVRKTDPELIDVETLLIFTDIFRNYVNGFWTNRKYFPYQRVQCYRAISKLWNEQLNKAEMAVFINKYLKLYKYELNSVLAKVSNTVTLQSALQDAPKWVQLLDNQLHYSAELLKGTDQETQQESLGKTQKEPLNKTHQEPLKKLQLKAPKWPPNLLSSLLMVLIKIYKSTDNANFVDTAAEKLHINKIDVIELWTSALLNSQTKYWAWRRAGDKRSSAAPAPTAAEWRLLDLRADSHRANRETHNLTKDSLEALELLLSLIEEYKAERCYNVQTWRKVYTSYRESGREASVVILQLRWVCLKMQSKKDPQATPFLQRVRNILKKQRNRRGTFNKFIDFLEDDFGDVDPNFTSKILGDNTSKSAVNDGDPDKQRDSDASSSDESLYKIKLRKEKDVPEKPGNNDQDLDSDTSRNLVIDDGNDETELQPKNCLDELDIEVKSDYDELYSLVNSESISIGPQHDAFRNHFKTDPCNQFYNSYTDVNEPKEVHEQLPETLLELNELDPDKIQAKIIMESDSDDDLTNNMSNSKSLKEDNEISIVNIRSATENNILKVSDANCDIKQSLKYDSINDVKKNDLKNSDTIQSEVSNIEITESCNQSDNDIVIHEALVKHEMDNEMKDRNDSLTNKDEDANASQNIDNGSAQEGQGVTNSVPDLDINKLLMQPQVVLSPCKYITKCVETATCNKIRIERSNNDTKSTSKCGKTEFIRKYNLNDLIKNPDYKQNASGNVTYSEKVLDMLSKCNMVTVDVERIDIYNLDKYIAPFNNESHSIKVKRELAINNETNINSAPNGQMIKNLSEINVQDENCASNKTNNHPTKNNEAIVEHSTNVNANQDINTIPPKEAKFVPEKRPIALPNLLEIRRSHSTMQMATVAPINIVKDTIDQTRNENETNVANAESSPCVEPGDRIAGEVGTYNQMNRVMDVTLSKRLRKQKDRLDRCLSKVYKILLQTPLYKKKRKTDTDPTTPPTDPSDALAEWIRQKNCNNQYFNVPGVTNNTNKTAKDKPKTTKNTRSKTKRHKQTVEATQDLSNVNINNKNSSGNEISEPVSLSSNIFQENRKRTHTNNAEVFIDMNKKSKVTVYDNYDITRNKILASPDHANNEMTVTSSNVPESNRKRQMTNEFLDISNKKIKDTQIFPSVSDIIDKEQSKKGQSLVSDMKQVLEKINNISGNKNMYDSAQDSESKDLSEVTSSARSLTGIYQNTNLNSLTNNDVVELSSDDDDLVIDESNDNHNALHQPTENHDDNNITSQNNGQLLKMTFSNYIDITPQIKENTPVPMFKITTKSTIINTNPAVIDNTALNKDQTNLESSNIIFPPSNETFNSNPFQTYNPTNSIQLPAQLLPNNSKKEDIIPSYKIVMPTLVPETQNSPNSLLKNVLLNEVTNTQNFDVNSTNESSDLSYSSDSQLSLAKVVKRTRNGPVLAIAPLDCLQSGQQYKANSYKFRIVRNRPTTSDPPQPVMDQPQSVIDPQSNIEPPQSVMDLPKSIMAQPQSILDPPQSIMDPPQSIMDPPQSVMAPPQSIIDPPQSIMAPPQVAMCPSASSVSYSSTVPLNINVKQLQENPYAPKMSLSHLTSEPPLATIEVVYLHSTGRLKYILRIDTTRPIWQLAGGKLVLTSENLWCRSEEYLTLDGGELRRPVNVFRDKNVIDLTSADQTNCWSDGPLYVCVSREPYIEVQVLTAVWSAALCANLVGKNASIYLFTPEDGKLFSTKVNLNITQQNALAGD